MVLIESVSPPINSQFRWSSDYPGQEELLKYVSKVASKYAIPEKAVLNTNVEEIRWNDDKQKWVATLKNLAAKAGEEAVTTLETDFVISAIGVLTDTSTCGIKGSMDGTFKGKEVHTGKWDDAWDWTGKRVAVIGCAASGIQVIPQIAAKAAQTIIYHRTPNHILPRENNKYSAEQIAEFKSNPAKYAEHRKATMAKFTFVTAALLDPEGDAQKFMRGVCQQHLEALIPESQKRMRSLLTPDFVSLTSSLGRPGSLALPNLYFPIPFLALWMPPFPRLGQFLPSSCPTQRRNRHRARRLHRSLRSCFGPGKGPARTFQVRRSRHF